MADITKQLGVQQMSPSQAIALEAAIVASPNQAMKALLVSRSTLYELINAGRSNPIPRADRVA